MLKKIYTILILFICVSPVYSHEVNVWDKLNVHSSPNVNSPVIGQLERGKFVSIQKQINGWSYIKYVSGQNYEFGYVDSSYISYSYPGCTIKPIPLNTNSTQYAYEKELYEMNRKCNIVRQTKCLQELNFRYENEKKSNEEKCQYTPSDNQYCLRLKKNTNDNFDEQLKKCYFSNQSTMCIGIDELRLLREKYNIHLPKYQDSTIYVHILN